MIPNGAYFSDPELAVACHLLRAGRWDLALAALPAGASTAVAEVRAGILVDRYLWRLDPGEDLEAAVADVAAAGNPTLAALLRGQVVYWGLLFASGSARGTAEEAEAELTRAGEDPTLAGWSAFWLGVVADNVHKDKPRAAGRYARAAEEATARRDRLLDSYVARHQGAHRLASDHDAGIDLLRRSLHLRASLGAVPQTAAAQATLADVLPACEEQATLRETALATARELDLTWLRRALEPRPGATSAA